MKKLLAAMLSLVMLASMGAALAAEGAAQSALAVQEPIAEEPQLPVFPDVAEGKWYTPYVLEMAQIGAVKGDPSGNFRPLGTVTRAEVISVLFNLAGGQAAEAEVPFSDVPDGKWFTEAIRWALAEDVITVIADQFYPNQPITRQELAVLLVRYQTNVVRTELSQEAAAPAFADNDQIAASAAQSIYILQKAGVVSGNNGRFDPQSTATRAELCKMLSCLLAAGAADQDADAPAPSVSTNTPAA